MVIKKKEADVVEDAPVDAKEAEAESTDEKKVASLEERKKKLLEKVAKLKGKVSGGVVSTESLKEQVKAKKKSDMLVPLEEYVKAGIYLGTKVVTPDMRPFVYRRRADGLAIFNTDLIDEKMKEGVEYLSQFNPEDIILSCKRQAGWRAAAMFSRLTGIRIFTKKYPAGILTNTQLPDFFETDLIFICDPWLDKNALADAKNIRIPVVGICDTNNHTTDIDVVIIGNNKSNKSMGLFFWLMAREYMKAHNIDAPLPSLEDFVGEKLILEEPRKKRLAREKKEQELKSGESAIEEKMRMLAEKADEEVKMERHESSKENKSISVGEEVEEGV